MEIMLLLVACATNVACFIIGAVIGMKVSRGEMIEVPTINPVKAIEERQAKKEAEFEQSKIDTIMDNVERYDGTPYGQKEVPRR